ncbi:glutamate--cysteine ligase regulatory subunit-like [Gigantopelta aegis]|uniref:glutamate--cysteine ligase regulatory subunit-like n=1 Tax=Gigantopelta aegis TaxID=1735272 RepID=UPI001B887C50|nr:glutamate--cysteine ligase regulatory subunit-like [Gigantopelta aegis]
MVDVIPVFPKAGSIFVYTGNIVNWNRLKRKPTQSSTEELKECITETLSKYLSVSDAKELQYTTDLVCVNSGFKESLPADERGDLKVTAKLLFCVDQPVEVITEAVEKVLTDLDISFIETLLLAFPEMQEKIDVDQIRPYWEVLEDLVAQERVLSIGTCDLDKGSLEELYEWAKVKPCTNQVNLASCCVMPQDLTEFAKANDIQLLTHSDPPEFMPADVLQEAIKSCTTEKDSFGWIPQWALRYSVIVKCRGIIRNKGYIFKAERNIKKRY